MAVVDFKVEWDGAVMRDWQELAKDLDTDAIAIELDLVHRKTILQGLRSIILLSPVDTGRFRAGWMPYMERQGVPWKDVLNDLRLAPKERKDGKKPKIDLKAVREGMKLGEVKEEPLDSTMINNVAYGPHLEKRFGMMKVVLPWLEERQRENFEAYWNSLVERVERGQMTLPTTDIEEGKLIG